MCVSLFIDLQSSEMCDRLIINATSFVFFFYNITHGSKIVCLFFFNTTHGDFLDFLIHVAMTRSIKLAILHIINVNCILDNF